MTRNFRRIVWALLARVATAAVMATPVLLNGCLNFPVHSWTQGQAAVDLGRIDQEFCFLTRVTGRFRGGGEQVRVYQKDGHWWLGGTSGQQGVGGNAVCLAQLLFTAGKGSTRLISPDVMAYYRYGSSGIWPVSSCDAGLMNGKQNARDGDWATVISGVSGIFVGEGEQVWVDQSPNPSEPSEIHTTTGQCDKTMRGWATSFFIGIPHSSSLPVFIGPHGQGTVAETREFVVDSRHGPSVVRMAPYDQAVCYFTEISGEFNGGGEYVEIYAAGPSGGSKSWFLQAHYLSGTGVHARARCLKFQQEMPRARGG